MASYAPYGNAIYGETAYGYPPKTYVQTTMSSLPIPSAGSPQAGLYNSLWVTWITPGGNWNEMILVRSSFGVPISPFTNDGVTLLDQTVNFSTSFLDTPLMSGRFYYYSLFVFDTDVNEWLLSSSCQGLCLTDFGFPAIYTGWTPDWYMEQDLQLTPSGPLSRFFGLVGFEMNWVRSEIESLYTLNSPEYISGAMLPFLGGNLGMGYEPALGMSQSRVLVGSAAELYKTKGTSFGVQAAASAYTGYPCELTLSQNVEIQLDDAAFDRSTGHWVAKNAGTSLSVVPSVTTYGITPEHTNYTPIQGNAPLSGALILENDIDGYIPPNLENVMEVTANAAFSWTQQSQNNATLPPVVMVGAMAVDLSNNTIVLFGGLPAPGASASQAYGQTWIFNGTSWNQVFPATSPPARYAHAMAYDSASTSVILFGGQDHTSATLDDTWSWNGTTWAQLTSTHTPGARASHAMAQWATTGVLLFGGFSPSGGTRSDTWLWNGTDWLLQSPANQPSARINHSMTYDSFERATPAGPGTGVVVLFGGANNSAVLQNDTWLWNGNNWIVQSPAHVPTARQYPVLTYDITNDTVLLFGGNGTSTQFFSDTWTWGGGDWKQITNSSNTPPGRYGHVMAYAPTLGKILLFSGYTANGMVDDNWLWNGTNWIQTEATLTPQPRFGAASCYDTATGNVLMFGGQGAISGVATFNSTWQWNNSTGWKQLLPVTSPPTLVNAQMVYTTGGTAILFGGENGLGNFTNQTWSWNGTTWALLSTSGGPPVSRSSHQMVYDSNIATTILFGGLSSGGTALSDTWYFASNTWTQQAPPASPLGTYDGAMVYTTGGISLLFGGFTQFGMTSALYQYDSGPGHWTQLTSLIPARAEHMLVYDTALSSTFLFGGINSTFQGDTDTWEYASGTWTQVNFGTPNPYPTEEGTAVYYPPTTSIWTFGGANGPAVSGSTWIGAVSNYGINISECDSTNATTLGIPVTSVDAVALSAYFQPVPSGATESFTMQLDWYGPTGGLISSTVGSAATELASTWVRASVSAAPPVGAAFFGRTIKSVSTNMNGDLHLVDAVQTEFGSSAATPSPTSWTPPRDLWLNLLPVARNLVVNASALAPGTFGWSAPNGGTLTVAGAASWPQNAVGGFQITSFQSGGNTHISAQTANMPVTPEEVYSGSIFLAHKAGASTLSFNVDIIWIASNGSTQISTVSGTAQTDKSPGNFFQITIQNVTPPSNALFAVMRITGLVTGNTTSTYIFGAPIFGPQNQLVFFDGNFSPSPDYEFEGTPNESITDYYPNLSSRLSRLVTIMPQYIPIGSTFSIYTHQFAITNAGLR